MCKDIQQQQTYVLQIFEKQKYIKNLFNITKIWKKRLIWQWFYRGVPDVNLCDKVALVCRRSIGIFRVVLLFPPSTKLPTIMWH